MPVTVKQWRASPPSRPTDSSTLTLTRQSSHILRPAHIYNRYVQIANGHTAFSDLLTTTQCTMTEHIEYTPMTQHVSSWHELVINFSTQQSPTLRLCSAFWGWASNARNMLSLWNSIKWKSEVFIKLVLLITKLSYELLNDVIPLLKIKEN
jgi:hypothetical protein